MGQQRVSAPHRTQTNVTWINLTHLSHQYWRWGLETTLCGPQFLPLQLTLKEFKLCRVYSGILRQIKPCQWQLVGQEAEFKFESKFKLLLFIWQSLPKALQEDIRRFWLQNYYYQLLSSWGSALAQLRLVWWAGINQECFSVCGSSCWQQQACFKKTLFKKSHHYCNTDLVQE